MGDMPSMWADAGLYVVSGLTLAAVAANFAYVCTERRNNHKKIEMICRSNIDTENSGQRMADYCNLYRLARESMKVSSSDRSAAWERLSELEESLVPEMKQEIRDNLDRVTSVQDLETVSRIYQVLKYGVLPRNRR